MLTLKDFLRVCKVGEPKHDISTPGPTISAERVRQILADREKQDPTPAVPE
jgi:hypothetical protein